MSNLFFKYLDERFHSNQIKSKKKCSERHPIITISRQAGCSANDIAALFYKSINKKLDEKSLKWKKVDKEIIIQSAKKLDLPPEKIKYVFNSKKRSTMDEIIEALANRYYKSDTIIRKTIVNVMKEFAERGNTIFVGRAGVALAQHVSCSFNIRLMAPIEWRVEQISKKHEVSLKEARHYIDEIDYQRSTLIEEFAGKPLNENMFDVIFNCKHLNHEEIVKSSLLIMQSKGLIV